MRKILITGILGQDGSYLVDHLLARQHIDPVELVGLVRRFDRRVEQLGVRCGGRIEFLEADLTDMPPIEHWLGNYQPDEIYHLAAATAPGAGWGAPPQRVLEVTGVATAGLLDAVWRHSPDSRVVCASSSAIYDPQRYGPYGSAKVLAQQAVRGYRKMGLWVGSAIFYSHTSPRQSLTFLARRLVHQLVTLPAGEKITLTAPDSSRDWGWAPDYVQALPLIARHSTPDDWVIATGLRRTVRGLVEIVLRELEQQWADRVQCQLDRADYFDESTCDPEQRLRTKHDLGWEWTTGWEAAIRRMTQAQIWANRGEEMVE